MGNEHVENFEVDIWKLLFAYMGKWWLILICTIGAALITGYFTANFTTPLYRASVTIYVNNARSDQQINYITSSNLDTAQRLVNTYIHIIKSDSVLEKVADESGLDITVGEIRSVMSATQVGETELFNLYITHADPYRAAQIANAIAEVAPQEITNFVEGSSTKIVDYAKVPVSPSSPNVSRSSILGGLIGCIVALLYITLRVLTDVRIKTEEDMASLFVYPVLGQIPAFVADGEKKNANKYAYERSGKGGK